MKETLLRAIYMPILLYMILQPMLSYLDYLYDLHVKSNAAYLAQKAAVEGRVTPELKQEIVNNLSAIGFSQDEIFIESDPGIHYRGERMDVIVRVERDRSLFPYLFTSESQPKFYYARDTIISEYLE